MKTEKLYDALSGIDRKYIETADDLDAIRTEFRRSKLRRVRLVTSVCGCLAAAALAVFAGAGGFRGDGFSGGDDLITVSADGSTLGSGVTRSSRVTEPSASQSAELTSDGRGTALQAAQTTAEQPDQNGENGTTAAYVPAATSEPFKGTDPDYDGLIETLIFGGRKYSSCDCIDADLSVGEYLGTVGEFHVGRYHYLRPENEVYALTESESYLVVKGSKGSLLYFCIEE